MEGALHSQDQGSTLDDRRHANAAAAADLAARVRDAGVESIYYQFVTLGGRVMAKVVPARHLARNLEHGVQFHGSAITDFATDRRGNLIASGPAAEEFVALPDATTFAVLPWAPTVGRFLCDLYRRRDAAVDAGMPLPTCARSGLRAAHARFSAATGLELRSGCEPEMSWFGPGLEPHVNPGASPAYHFGALELMRPVAERVVAYAGALGLDMIEGDYEDTGQLELNFQYDRCEATCDRLVTFRLICVQVARELGVTASFMPKPTVGAMANGCHHNLSLWRGESNVFAEPGRRELHLSETARHALGGLLAHAPGMLALLAPTVNSYARYWDVGQFAPSIVNWGFDNRTCAVRVSASGRLEFKLPDASVNPYLSHTAILAALADGLARRADPGAPQGGDSYDAAIVAADVAARGLGVLPRTLGDALAALAADGVVCGAFPPALLDAYVALKTDEWERFCGAVTDWHREMYLHAIP
jgi:glutamine synthetase